MVERERDLKRTPEKSSVRALPLVDRLVRAYQARQDFSNATRIAQSVNEGNRNRDEALGVIVRAQQESGIEPFTHELNPISLDDYDSSFGQRATEFRQKTKTKEELDVDLKKAEDNSERYGILLEYAEIGCHQEAEAILRKLNRRPQGTDLDIPYALAYIAAAKAKAGIDPSEEIEKTLEKVKDVKIKERDPMHQSPIYLKLAEASFAYGLDPLPMTERALEKAEQEVAILHINPYLDIARTQIHLDQDPKQTISTAIDIHNRFNKEGEYNPYSNYLHDIFWILVEAGYYDDARETLNTYDSYGDQDFLCVKAELLAELAKAQALNGLSQEEIDNLSNNDIQTILAGSNEVVKQAVLYFGTKNNNIEQG